MPDNRIDAARAFLADKDNDPADLREVVASSDAEYAETLFALLRCDVKRSRNRAAKLVAGLGAESPRLLRPHWSRLAGCVSGGGNIVRWNALVAIGCVAPFVSDAEVRALLPGLFALLEDESMVTAGHAVGCLGKVAAAKPAHRAEILRRIVAIDEVPRDPECIRILAGKALAALEPLGKDADPAEKAALLGFVERHEESLRPGARRLAGRVRRKL